MGFVLIRVKSGLGGYGRNPDAELMHVKVGMLYGVTLSGGVNNGGLVFQIAPDGSGYKTLYAFSESGAEGHRPYAGLALGTDGSLYGTTSRGGPTRAGAIYRVQLPP
jgi:uncharacterized repeat protein (TIGR03803 family)